MPWNTGSGNGGGPWGGGNPPGGTPPNNPWGNGPRKGGGGRGPGQQPPDFEDILRKGQDRMKGWFPRGPQGPRAIVLGLAVLVAAWASSGFYKVQSDEQGVELLFGEFVKSTEPGLHYWFPAPVGDVTTVSVTNIRQINIGAQLADDTQRRYGQVQRSSDDRQVLTADQNVVDADYSVFWRVAKAEDFLFNIRDPEATIRRAAESAMREVAGRSSLDQLMTDRKEALQAEMQTQLQALLDYYGAGVAITGVKLLAVDPPKQVIEAFHDVNNARQDLDRQRNEANAYRNDIIPRAKGEAEKIQQDALAYKERQVKDAQGEADRFNSVYDSYKVAAPVTRERLYIETMQDVLSRSNKVLIDPAQGGSGVVPYLPLPEIQKRGNAAPANGANMPNRGAK
ncbi:HflK protein [uncultured Alphaproteobacteria bacterium]|uniref:Protein HflK n=1 Tax=uncultured Alphaproteobacteria bacterium TaxID=91750 RepID=A0A212JK26_9PROT|nr:HflK protein [uncultured Alphaproteobacteria bacterium]